MLNGYTYTLRFLYKYDSVIISVMYWKHYLRPTIKCFSLSTADAVCGRTQLCATWTEASPNLPRMARNPSGFIVHTSEVDSWLGEVARGTVDGRRAACPRCGAGLLAQWGFYRD